MANDASRRGEQMSLRPEATASVVRAYIEHGMHALPGNVKLYYIGPMFRRERPQKGRYRQFYQIGAELLGPSDAPAIDAEMIEMLLVFFGRVGLTGTTLYVNSIGDKNCRPKYVELLREELRKVKDQLGPDSQRRIETNPLRVLDSKLPRRAGHHREAAAHLRPSLRRCREHFAKLKDELTCAASPTKKTGGWCAASTTTRAPRLKSPPTGLGSQNAVCGGGRYDGLVELLGGTANDEGHRLRHRHRPRDSLDSGSGQAAAARRDGCVCRVDGRDNVSRRRGDRAQSCASRPGRRAAAPKR